MIETIIDMLPLIGIAGYTVRGGNQFWTPGAFESNFSPFEDKGTDITVRNPYSGNQNDIDTGNINFEDKNQVMNIQKALNAAGAVDSEGNPLDVDGKFGPNTEFAYRNYINQKRTSQGKDAYGYGSEAPMNVNEENMNVSNGYNYDNNTTFDAYGDGISVPSEELAGCLLYTSPSPRDLSTSRMPSSA